MPSDNILVGMQLTAGDVLVLERRLQDAPADVMVRSQLVGYYAGAMLASFDAAQRLERHALWLIENAPDASRARRLGDVGALERLVRIRSIFEV
jgi:hypothetical protein